MAGEGGGGEERGRRKLAGRQAGRLAGRKSKLIFNTLSIMPVILKRTGVQKHGNAEREGGGEGGSSGLPKLITMCCFQWETDSYAKAPDCRVDVH